ncbi:MAG: prepilin-type N-terminal cleavage/methylation domain-containing protein [Candidatus Pacebacteria bacterium]|jgi:prepilin-type N-terminal cleavage/methylation domain-containing protein|nr:hypothetical protein [bacterium]MDP6527932.1 prepilin-type N-terminal cleavage/methylation domain-containing protein [Candidatus Paceibacterota bacterium]MDP6659464.1 prepilin-type N-terminal cleavage/methylation domain-containing protein [Candidatus Paceibacterota bacterium]|tara:strand:- start:6003 stop:6503 length:501 start_codon:yes stop_codon:yes gene_type:complete
MSIRKNSRGFTIIETIVAITVLVVSVAAPLTLAARGLSSAFFARDQITAFYLTQEAVEFIRNKRDENVLGEDNWLAEFPATNGDPFTIDVTDGDMDSCSGTCENLKFNTSTLLYNYNSGDTTRFTRTVSINLLNATEAEVIVTIAWTAGLFSRTFSIQENILNWKS